MAPSAIRDQLPPHGVRYFTTSPRPYDARDVTAHPENNDLTLARFFALANVRSDLRWSGNTLLLCSDKTQEFTRPRRTETDRAEGRIACIAEIDRRVSGN